MLLHLPTIHVATVNDACSITSCYPTILLDLAYLNPFAYVSAAERTTRSMPMAAVSHYVTNIHGQHESVAHNDSSYHLYRQSEGDGIGEFDTEHDGTTSYGCAETAERKLEELTLKQREPGVQQLESIQPSSIGPPQSGRSQPSTHLPAPFASLSRTITHAPTLPEALQWVHTVPVHSIALQYLDYLPPLKELRTPRIRRRVMLTRELREVLRRNMEWERQMN